jgi:hypothetical protein
MFFKREVMSGMKMEREIGMVLALLVTTGSKATSRFPVIGSLDFLRVIEVTQVIL